MLPTQALASIDAVAAPHRVGHRCQDGTWHNPHAGARTSCAVLVHLDAAAGHVTAMHAAVHDAAHDDDVARYVGAAAAGFTGADCDRAHPDDQAGFTSMGRYAIEALCAELDRDPVREARIEATRARLAAAGIAPSV